MKKRIRIQGALIFLVIISLLLFSKFIIPDWQNEPFEEFFDILGILLVLFGFLLRILARGYKEEMSDAGHTLVDGGPYSLMRNPMYFGTLLIGTGVIAVLFRLWTLPLFLIIYIAIYIPQVNREEKILLSRFGDAYKSFCAVSPKYFPNIPRLLHFRKHASMLRWSWFKKESGPMIATITVIFLIETWQDMELFGFGVFLEEFFEFLLVLLTFFAVISILAHGKHDG